MDSATCPQSCVGEHIRQLVAAAVSSMLENRTSACILHHQPDHDRFPSDDIAGDVQSLPLQCHLDAPANQAAT